MNTTTYSILREEQRRDNRNFAFVIFILMLTGLLAVCAMYYQVERRYETLWAQSEAQNSCLILAVEADAQGRTGEALNYMRLAHDSQYDSLSCE